MSSVFVYCRFLLGFRKRSLEADAKGLLPTDLAALGGHEEAVRILVATGTNLDVVTEVGSRPL
jgi:ankyrin repeat protein